MKNRLAFILVMLSAIIAFQNCGQGGFDSGEGATETSLSSTATGGTDTTQPKTCSFNGRSLGEGQSVTAYQASTSTNSCVSQTRTCKNGVLSGSYVYASCAVGQPASCLFNGMTVPSGQSIVAYAAASVPYGQSCQTETRTCSSGTLSGSFAASSCSVGLPDISGNWLQACRSYSSGSAQQRESFGNGSFQIVTNLYPLDTGCGTQYATANISGNYSVGAIVDGTANNRLDLRNVTTQLTPSNAFAAYYLNSIAFCGLRNWQDRVTQNVTGRSCAINGYGAMIPSGTLLTSFKIVNGNALYQAVPNDNSRNGSSESTRAIDLDTVPLMRQ